MRWVALGSWSKALVYLPALACAAVYLSMTPGQITLANNGEDGGDLLAAALTGGVPHPTGYPTYILLLRLFLRLPFGSAYWRGSVLSALAAAACVYLISARIAHRQGNSAAGRVGALAGGLALGFAPLFWGQAVIVEVQALHALAVALVIWWATLLAEGSQTNRKKWLCVLLAGCTGLGMGNHVTLAFTLPVVLACFWKATGHGLGRGWLIGQVGAFLTGCLVYIYLPLTAGQHPPINWGDPQTLNRFGWVVSGALYHGMLLSGSVSQMLGRAGDWLRLAAAQFTLPALAVIGAGWVNRAEPSKMLRWGLAWIAAIFTFFYIAYNSRDAMVYLVAPWMVIAMWIGQGVAAFWEMRVGRMAFGLFACGVVLVCLVGRVLLAWKMVNPSADTATAVSLEASMQELPTNALVFTTADADTFPIWYAHFGLGERKDLRVVTTSLAGYDWYRETVRHMYPDLNFPKEGGGKAWIDDLASFNVEREICHSTIDATVAGRIVIKCNP